MAQLSVSAPCCSLPCGRCRGQAFTWNQRRSSLAIPQCPQLGYLFHGLLVKAPLVPLNAHVLLPVGGMWDRDGQLVGAERRWVWWVMQGPVGPVQGSAGVSRTLGGHEVRAGQRGVPWTTCCNVL